MEPLPSNYAHLDAAASQLAHILRKEGIPHVFLGGYAAGLLGSQRITKDINIVTERSAGHVLNGVPEFSWSREEKRWKYGDGEIEVNITTSMPDSSPGKFPSPRAAGRHTVSPRDLPRRSIYAKIDILHPSVLVLTKLKTWYAAEVSQEPSLQRHSRAHFVDIMASLQWLSDEHERINLEGYPGVPKNELLHLLCRLYQMHHQARPYLASTLSFKDMRDVLCS
ncbi:hypothetical protein N7465_006097 [Penicillium sp. CMV-2018d]|nr:hypothetical protein N7465_006097 [Penicillium sp. CMV-2018d]